MRSLNGFHIEIMILSKTIKLFDFCWEFCLNWGNRSTLEMVEATGIILVYTLWLLSRVVERGKNSCQ